MKKLLQNPQYLKHSQAIARRVLKRRQTALRQHVAVGLLKPHARFSFSSQLTLVAPKCFSLLQNASQMLDLFNEIRENCRKRRIFIDMSNIEEMTCDAILYALSALSHYGPEIWGNAPVDARCHELFVSSGFLTHMQTGIPLSPPNMNILSIQAGNDADGRRAKLVLDFVRKHFGSSPALGYRSIYTTILECMSNTMDHAYAPSRGKWWLMALRDGNDSSRVRFTFLDNGKGIPKTVRRNFQNLVPTIMNPSDAGLIIAALNGKFRSRTGKRERGKGLPKINSLASTGAIANLTIISDTAYIAGGKGQTLPRPFDGTLLTWEIVNPHQIQLL
jgi:hypothetical protein